MHLTATFRLLKTVYLLSLLSLLCISAPGYGALRYQLLQGLDFPIKIGFVMKESNNAISRTFLMQSLKDLNATGELKAAYLSNKPSELNSINFRHHCEAQSIQYIVQLQVKSSSANQPSIVIKCIKLGKTLAQDQVILKKTQAIINTDISKAYRTINNEIYYAIQGQPSPFFTPIAFVTQEKIGSQETQYQLKIATLDGSDDKTLYTSNEPIFSLTFSPLNNTIAYTALESGHASIYFYDLTSNERKRITHFSTIDNSPNFSPDGKRLAFVAEHNKKINIYIMDLNTKKIKQLTHGYSIDTEPVFAKDGQSLIFTSNRNGSPQLYQYSFKTQTVKRLTYEGSYNAHASFTMDGQSIVFIHRESDTFEIAKMNLRSKTIDILTGAGQNQSPTVSPNGQMVLYTTTYGNHQKALELISLDGNIRARLTSSQGNLQASTWVSQQPLSILNKIK